MRTCFVISFTLHSRAVSVCSSFCASCIHRAKYDRLVQGYHRPPVKAANARWQDIKQGGMYLPTTCYMLRRPRSQKRCTRCNEKGKCSHIRKIFPHQTCSCASMTTQSCHSVWRSLEQKPDMMTSVLQPRHNHPTAKPLTAQIHSIWVFHAARYHICLIIRTINSKYGRVPRSREGQTQVYTRFPTLQKSISRSKHR